MSTPVTVSKWAGNFDCSVCRRKRLMADEFSKTAIEKHIKNDSKLKCKKCVSEQEERERADAAVRQRQVRDESRVCSRCKSNLPCTEYNRNQWNKGEGKARCRLCVEAALVEERSQQELSKAEALAKARAHVETARKSGNLQSVVAAESELAALEAQQVTGLSPVKLGAMRRGRDARFTNSGRKK